MKDQGNKRGSSRKVETPDPKAAAGKDVKTAPVKTAPVQMTAKEKIAANQKNKRRK